MQRAGVESILGVRRHGAMVTIEPCIPKAWPGFSVRLRQGATLYTITVENPRGTGRGVTTAETDGVAIDARPVQLPLADDGKPHAVRIVLG